MSAPPPYCSVTPPAPHGYGYDPEADKNVAYGGSYPGWQVPPPTGTSHGTNTYSTTMVRTSHFLITPILFFRKIRVITIHGLEIQH